MKKWLLFILLAIPSVSFGQGVRYDNIAIRGGAPLQSVANAVITVCTSAGTGLPCTPTATTYTDATLSTPCAVSKPVVLANTSTCVAGADIQGNYGFWVAPGKYVVTVTAVGVPGYSTTLTLQCPLDGNCTTTGNNTHSGTETFTGPGSISAFTAIQGCQQVDANQSFSAALTAVGSSGCMEITPGNWSVSANATIPVGVGLFFKPSSILSIANAVTLTINGTVHASEQPIFAYTGTGVAVFGGNNAGFINVEWFPGATADVQINNAIAAIPNGGFLDMRTYGATTQTIAATVTIGNVAGATMTAFFDRSTTYNCTITNNTPCIKVLGDSTMMGFGTQNRGLFVVNGASVSNGLLVQHNQVAGIAGSFVEGLTVYANTGATVSDALCGVQNTLQLLKFLNVSCASLGATNLVLLKVYATGGAVGITNPFFDNVQIDCGGFTGCRPIWIGCTASGSLTGAHCNFPIMAINFFGGLAVHPGTGGIPIVQLEAQDGAGGTNSLQNITFVGLQIESSNAADIGILANGVQAMGVYGLYASERNSNGGDIIKIAQPAGTTADGIVIQGVTNAAGIWTNTINNTILTDTVTGAQCANGCNYSYGRGNASAQKRWRFTDANGIEATLDGNGLTLGYRTNFTETTAPTGIANLDVAYGDSTAHAVPLNYNNAGYTNFLPKTVALTADWTCGTGGTVSSCVAATIIGSGGGVPLTFNLPLVANSSTLVCDGVVGQATAATSNQWNLLTATNGATNVTANYTMATAATAFAAGAVTDQASTTTTFQIAPSWTLGGTATKMPFHVWAKIEGASASGTVVSLQLVAPTVADLVTIYRGSACTVF